MKQTYRHVVNDSQQGVGEEYRTRNNVNLGRFIAPHGLGREKSPPTPFSVRGYILDNALRFEIWEALQSNSPFIQATTTATKTIEQPPVDLSAEEAENELEVDASDGAQWSVDPIITYRAEVGQVLREVMDLGPTRDEVIEKTLSHGQGPLFENEAPGLPQVLLRSAASVECTTSDALRLRLIPSPWSAPGATTSSELDLTLSLDRNTQTVKVDELRAICKSPGIQIALPQFATDVEFVKEISFILNSAGEIPNIKSFLRKIEDSAAGFGKISAPPFLRLGVPAAFIRGPGSDTTGQTMEVEYFVKSLRFEQTLQMEYAGHDLLIERSKVGERLMLRMKNQKKIAAIEADLQPSEEKEDFLKFVGSVDSLLKGLNEGVGNPRMTPLDLEGLPQPITLVNYTMA